MKRYVRYDMAPFQYAELSKEIQNKLYDAGADYLLSEGWDMSDIADYFIVEVDAIPEDKRIRIEVRAELDNDEFGMLIFRHLNSIVAKYDKFAYFEMVAPGIAKAFIELEEQDD